MQFEQVYLEELLIPIYSYNIKTLYDIDCVQRILQHCLYFDQQALESIQQGIEEGDLLAKMIYNQIGHVEVHLQEKTNVEEFP